MQYCEYTNVGLKREINQDSILALTNDEAGLFVVADGMGGHTDGEVASRAVTDACKNWWLNSFLHSDGLSVPDAVEELKVAIDVVNKKIMNRTMRTDTICGTTVAILLISNGIYAAMNIGDSRIYICSNNKTRRISFDHTIYSMEAVGGLSPENFSKKDKLLQAVGATKELNWHCVTDSCKKGDKFFLCSDGVYKFFPENLLFDEIKKYRDDDKTSLSIEKVVLDKGANDNFSFIAVNTSERKAAAKKQSKIIMVSVIAAIVLIIGAVTAISLSSRATPTAVSLQEQLSLGEKYLIKLDYENAVMAFEAVIEIEPRNVEAYLGLAEAYIGLDETEKAIKALEDGIAATDDQRLKDKLTELTKVEETAAETTAEIVKKEAVWLKTKETRYNPDGTMWIYYSYEYDEYGNRIKEISNNPDGTTGSIYSYEYDENGNEIKSTYYNSDGEIFEYSISEYDQYGNLIEQSDFNKDGIITRRITNEYKDGQVYSQLLTSSECFEKTEYSYSSDGMRKEISFYPNENLCSFTTIIRYNADGKISESISYYSDVPVSFDANGRADDGIGFKFLKSSVKHDYYEYDSLGREIHYLCQDLGGKSFTDTEYDENGNVSKISKSFLINGKKGISGYTTYSYEQFDVISREN